jgi:uncharacterized protein (DUF1697 family)
MATFVAMLRSVNVAGRNRLPMADLRTLMSGLGFKSVTTYLQSGNIVFSGKGTPKAVGRAIEQQITTGLGLEVPVVVRSRHQLHKTIDSAPFSHPGVDPKTRHVTFLAELPEPNAVEGLVALDGRFGTDQFQVVGCDVFLHCPGGYGETKLTNAFLERRLGVAATTRNWRTVLALADMAGVPAREAGA